MRAVAQRVASASVRVGEEIAGSIGMGVLVYVGAGRDDTEGDADYVANKVAGLRIFEDERGRMSRSVEDVGGEVLVVSQFTLYGDVRRGRRPSFDAAAQPQSARALCGRVVARLQERGLGVATGRFGAMMAVHCEVDGPVTILVDSAKEF